MESNLSPVVLFVFNRPQHTADTLNSLKDSFLAESTDLFVFCDKPRHSDSNDCKKNNNEVINLFKNLSGFRSVTINVRETNYGLSKNIIHGIDEILNKYDKVIVLEDDMIVSKYFLKYMNDALSLYEKDDDVACIHAWNYSYFKLDQSIDTFFLPGGDCWGWATWKNSWNFLDRSSCRLLLKLIFKNKIYIFNRNNTVSNIDLLLNNIFGYNDSWAIRWHASLVLNNKYCLYPYRSLLYNTGLDSSGTNCININLKQDVSNLPIDIQRIKVVDSEWYYEQYNLFNEEIHKINTIWKFLFLGFHFIKQKLKIYINTSK